MPFELENTKADLQDNLDWLYVQEYRTGENHVTESLFKWFYFSDAAVQRRFLSAVCQVRGKRVKWRRLNLQKRGKRGTPDAVIRLGDDSELLFEVKTKQKSISRGQIRRHLNDAGLRKRVRRRAGSPKLVLMTPDLKEPKKLADLSPHYKQAVLWVPWIELLDFLKKLRSNYSRDRFLRDGLLVFLKEEKLFPI